MVDILISPPFLFQTNPGSWMGVNITELTKPDFYKQILEDTTKKKRVYSWHTRACVMMLHKIPLNILIFRNNRDFVLSFHYSKYCVVCTEMSTHAVREVCCSVILFASSILNSRKLVVAICWCHICLRSHKLYLRVPAYSARRGKNAEKDRNRGDEELQGRGAVDEEISHACN